MKQVRQFRNVAASVSEARHYVLDALGDIAPPVAEAVSVMLSELATNAVRHTPSSHFTVTLERTAARIRVAVSDSGPGEPAERSPKPSEPSGRGLQIVRALSTAWGVVPSEDGRGKTVWFVVAIESEGGTGAVRSGRTSSPEHEDGSIGGRQEPAHLRARLETEYPVGPGSDGLRSEQLSDDVRRHRGRKIILV